MVATVSGNHQDVLESLLNRLESVTSRLEGLQVCALTKYDWPL